MRTIGVSASGHLVGEFVPAAKLTFAKVEEMRRLRIVGMTYKELGKHFGVDQSTAHRIITGKAWVTPIARKCGEATQADVDKIRALVAQDYGYARIAKRLNTTAMSVLRVMKENSLEGKSPTAENSKKTHCKHGHPLTGSNLYVRPDGDRACRECRKLADQRHKSRNAQRASQ